MYVIFCKYCIDAINDVIPSKLILLPQEMLKIAQVIKKMHYTTKHSYSEY